MMKFDIQMFADTITSSEVLQIKNTFTDGDTRTIDVPDPRDDVSASDITELETWILANNALIGDKDGAPFAYVDSAIIVETNRVKLDIKSA